MDSLLGLLKETLELKNELVFFVGQIDLFRLQRVRKILD